MSADSERLSVWLVLDQHKTIVGAYPSEETADMLIKHRAGWTKALLTSPAPTSAMQEVHESSGRPELTASALQEADRGSTRQAAPAGPSSPDGGTHGLRTAQQLLELYQDDTRYQLCQRLAQTEGERNNAERERDALREWLAKAKKDCEAFMERSLHFQESLSAALAKREKVEAALQAMRDWHRTYHGEDRCNLCVQTDAALAPQDGGGNG